MKSIVLRLALVASFGLLAACGANAGEGSDSSSDDALTRSKKCVDILTLTCKSGYEPSEVGCAQSRVVGAHPLGHCVASEPMDTCVDMLTLTCEAGFEASETGCAQSHVVGAHPLGHCVATAAPPSDACVDMLTLTCEAGFEASEVGCAQSHVEGAHPFGRCVAR
jgi:hypothetical protein